MSPHLVFFLNPRLRWLLPAQPVRVLSRGPAFTPSCGSWLGFFQPRSITEVENSGVFWEAVCPWLQRHSWFISQKMKATDTMAYKTSRPLGGKEHVEENAPWDLPLRAAVAAASGTECQVRESQRPFKQKRGKCRKAAGHWWWASGLCPEASLFGNTWVLPLRLPRFKISKFSNPKVISLHKRGICGH